MSQKIVTIDAFTDKPFSGNPAAVCLMAEAAEESWMQSIASEMNLSETAFLYPSGNGYHLRWFTPAAEVELCGHATLATAHLLYQDGHLAPEETALFHTLSGKLTASLNGSQIELDFPVTPAVQCEPPLGLIDALGVEPIYVGRDQYDLLAELRDADAVRELSPDFGKMLKVKARGIMVTAKSDQAEYDFISRFFAPAVGINEDPVTGSAHCMAGPYWQEKLGKSELSAYQASTRGGKLTVRIDGDRVKLAGNAVIVMRAELV